MTNISKQKSRIFSILITLISLFILTLLIFSVELFLRKIRPLTWYDFFPRKKIVNLEFNEALEKRLKNPRYVYLDKIKHNPKRNQSNRRQAFNCTISPDIEHGEHGNMLPNLFNEKAIAKDSGEVLYDYNFTINEYGRRELSPKYNHLNFSEYLIFYGCSFTFGNGSPDGSTIPDYTQEKLQSVHIYNASLPGVGPNKILYFLSQKDDPRNQGIKESSGIAIYVYIDDHIPRVLGSASWLARLPEHIKDPYYSLENNKLIFNGTFEKRGFLNKFLLKLGESGFVHFFALDFPRMNQNNEKLFAAIIDEIAHLAKQRFNARKFIVVGYPENSFLFKNWTRHIKNPIVQTVDYSNIYLTSILKENDIIWGEGHPSALANQFFTDLLVEDLKKLGIVQ